MFTAFIYNDELILGNKRSDVDDANNIIFDGVRYAQSLQCFLIKFA